MRLWRILLRSCRLRCPACGQGKLFHGYLAMHETCGHCGLRFGREPGYFLGSIYFNYGVTTVIVLVAYLTLFLGAHVSPDVLLWTLGAFCFVFPFWFFRYARSLWLGMDQLFDPRTPEANSSAVDKETSPWS